MLRNMTIMQLKCVSRLARLSRGPDGEPCCTGSLDQLLLEALQRDASLTNAELGERISLSASQVSRRCTRLEQAGVIARYHARINDAMPVVADGLVVA